MKKGKQLIIWSIIIIAVIAVAAVLWIKDSKEPRLYDAFAQCLKDKGTVFYGTFWCPHCQNQKKLFGSSAKYLPYVECSTSDGKSQLQVCSDKGIQGYPTWEFSDGSRLSREVSMAELSEKTGCPLPQ